LKKIDVCAFWFSKTASNVYSDKPSLNTRKNKTEALAG